MLENLRNDLLDDFVIYGEVYGGNIQSGMCYKLEQDFVAFDMRWINEDGSLSLPLNKLTTLTLEKDYNIPVCYGFPAGHTEPNYPLIIGRKVQLVVNEEGAELTFSMPANLGVPENQEE